MDVFLSRAIAGVGDKDQLVTVEDDYGRNLVDGGLADEAVALDPSVLVVDGELDVDGQLVVPDGSDVITEPLPHESATKPEWLAYAGRNRIPVADGALLPEVKAAVRTAHAARGAVESVPAE